MTHPDFRALCAELADYLAKVSEKLQTPDDINEADQIEFRLRAALAAPQQGAPSDDELRAAFADNGAWPGGLRAVADLGARYGAQVVPVPVVEPDYGSVLLLAAIIREVDGSNKLGAAPLAEAILSHRAITGALPLPEAQP